MPISVRQKIEDLLDARSDRDTLPSYVQTVGEILEEIGPIDRKVGVVDVGVLEDDLLKILYVVAAHNPLGFGTHKPAMNLFQDAIAEWMREKKIRLDLKGLERGHEFRVRKGWVVIAVPRPSFW